jgi:AcrR family transcriptional regulator
MFNKKTCARKIAVTRRDDSKAETRRLILNAAHSLFWKKGPDDCTMRDIAKKAGVSPASIIVHFKNKTALLEVALYEKIEETVAKALATLPSDKGLHAVFMHMASVMLSFYDKNRELYRVLVRDTLFEPDQESPSIAKLDEGNLEFIATLIDQEKEMGTVRKEIDSYLAGSSIFYLYIGVLRDFLRNPELSVTKAVNRLSEMLEQHLAGILVRGRKR